MWNEILTSGVFDAPLAPSYRYQGDITIVIPVFNDKDGLYKTLFSLNVFNKYNIIIVDDCSTQDNYDDVVQFFSSYFNITLVQTPKNGGPAVAKNYGASLVNTKYVMFMDAGDTFVSAKVIVDLEKVLSNEPRAVILSAAFYEELSTSDLSYVGPSHNTWRGKVYRVDFYKRYNLHFLEESSFSNDDIGMNMLARLLVQEYQIIHFDSPVMIWHYSENSITRRENHRYLYRENNSGIAAAANYALNEGEKYRVDNRKLDELRCSALCQLYFNYLGTLNVAPEYEEECLAGAKMFYDISIKGRDIIPPMLTDLYNITLKEKLSSKQVEPCLVKIQKCNFADFLDKLEG